MSGAAKVCGEPGCPNLQPCAAHERKPWAGSTRRTRTASGWQQQRDAELVMRRDRGICHWCGQPGADEVDHVVPTAEDGTDRPSNKAPIHSRPCHEQKTAAEAARARKRRA